MAVRYTSQKCDSCGSTKFDYIEKLNLWECIYCGNRIERHEEADTLFTIKNVVRQVLVDVSYQKFNEAKNNLVECEKIDSRYVGTTIARLGYLLNAAMYNANSQQEQRNMFSQIKKYYAQLCSAGEKPSEEEQILYEFFDSAEAIGTLILVYDTLGAQKRLEAIYPLFRPEEVYSLKLNSNLLRFMLSHQKYDVADKIVENYDNIDKKSALLLVLEQYPDSGQKVSNCSLLLAQNVLTSDDRSVIENYLNSSSDCFETKYGIACAALTTAAAPTVKCVMSTIIAKANDKELVRNMMDIIMSGKLMDAEVRTIVEYALQKCSQDVALYILERLDETNQFVVFDKQHFIMLFENKAIDDAYKEKIIDIALKFNVNIKAKEQMVSYYLLNVSDEPDKRESFLSYLFGLIPSLSTASAEKYIVSCTLDKENKPEIVKKIFDMDINKAYFREVFDKYLTSSVDSRITNEKVIDVLAQEGFKVSEGSLIKMLLNSSFPEEKRIELLKKILSSGICYPGALDKYLAAVVPAEFSMHIFQELKGVSETISANSFVKYLWLIRDAEAAKPVNVQQLAEKCKLPVLSQIYRIMHLNNSIECDVLQAYILISPDSPPVTCSVAQALGAHSHKLNTNILVSGEKKKFKKYLSSVSSRLSASSKAAAQACGLI